MYFDEQTENFYHKNEILDMKEMKWVQTKKKPSNLVEYSYVNAVKKLQTTKHKIKLPIGVIGSGNPDEHQYNMAVNLGRILAGMGLAIICGGRTGIMEAVCKGVAENNGISLGILPESSLENANSYVSIPLATGIGFARNALITSSALCLVAIGGGNGTLCEIAYGLQFKKVVFTLESKLLVDDVIKCLTVEDVVNNICKLIFNIKLSDK